MWQDYWVAARLAKNAGHEFKEDCLNHHDTVLVCQKCKHWVPLTMGNGQNMCYRSAFRPCYGEEKE